MNRTKVAASARTASVGCTPPASITATLPPGTAITGSPLMAATPITRPTASTLCFLSQTRFRLRREATLHHHRGNRAVRHGPDQQEVARPDAVVGSGPGPIGLMALRLVKVLGAGTVIFTGTRKERLEMGLFEDQRTCLHQRQRAGRGRGG